MKLQNIINKYENKLAHYTNKEKEVDHRRKTEPLYMNGIGFANEVCLCRNILKDLKKIQKKQTASPRQSINH